MSVGKSFYTSDEFRAEGKKYNPIGNYGIGFLACFMLSDKVSIATKSYKENHGYIIELEKDSEYICVKNNCEMLEGTSVILDLDTTLKTFNNDFEVMEKMVVEYFLDCNIDFKRIVCKEQKHECKNII